MRIGEIFLNYIGVPLLHFCLGYGNIQKNVTPIPVIRKVYETYKILTFLELIRDLMSRAIKQIPKSGKPLQRKTGHRTISAVAEHRKKKMLP